MMARIGCIYNQTSTQSLGFTLELGANVVAVSPSKDNFARL